jgi:hypothetical protein
MAELHHDADEEFSEKLFDLRGSGSFSCMSGDTNVKSEQHA